MKDTISMYIVWFLLGMCAGTMLALAIEERRGWREQLGKESVISQAYQHGLTDCRELTWGGVKEKK